MSPESISASGQGKHTPILAAVFDDLMLSPASFLSVWAAGICFATAAVARWKVVGAGFFWIACGAIVAVGAGAAFGGPAAIAAMALTVAAALFARRGEIAWWFLVAAGLAFALGADTSLSLVATGAAAWGGVSVEMLLGHWYLVDPRLPRSALRRLAGAAMLGIVADAALLSWAGAASGHGLLGVAFVVLAGMGLLLMVGVWFAIGETGYEGVMAATGLSYLAVLTVLGAAALGRGLL